jgi:hypothetical protein
MPALRGEFDDAGEPPDGAVPIRRTLVPDTGFLGRSDVVLKIDRVAGIATSSVRRA